MPGNCLPCILETYVSLDCGDDHVSHEPDNGDKAASDQNFRFREGREEAQKVADDHGSDYTAHQSFPGLAGAHLGKNLVPSQQFPPGELEDVVDLGDEYDEQQQSSSSCIKPGEAGQGNQKGQVTDREDREYQLGRKNTHGPTDVFGFPLDDEHEGNPQIHEHRDKD